MGELTLAAGALEGALVAIGAIILQKKESDVRKIRKAELRKKIDENLPPTWSVDTRTQTHNMLINIKEIYKERNELIHTAFALAMDSSVHGVPAGSIIDANTYGHGFVQLKEANSLAIALIAKRIHIEDIDAVTEKLHAARLALVPLMELVDEMLNNKRVRITKFEAGKRLRDYEP